MPEQIKNKILEAAKIVGAITIIQGGLIAIATPFVNEHIEQRIKDYHNSSDFKLYVDGVIEEYKSKTTSTTSLRDLLSDKMGVPSDEVHIELGDLFKNGKLIQEEINLLREKIKEIIREIHYYHSDSILTE